jgi:3-oxoacyl-[acyl-carrier protein] reductase
VNVGGRTALVTGGASGLGLAFAGALASLGARVWVLDRDEAALARAAGELPPSCVLVRCDVGDERQVAEAVAGAGGEAGGIGVLVNSAAVLHDQALVSRLRGRVRQHGVADWHETLRSNLTGVFLVTRAVAAAMVERGGGGLVVNLSSVVRHGNPGQSAYAATKSAVDALTVTWAQELAVYGIRVVGIAPGFVPTPMTARIPALFLDRIRERTPVRRFGTPAEFARTLQFVVDNDYLNGRTIEIDGGLRF